MPARTTSTPRAAGRRGTSERAGDARRTSRARVLEGWALNVSRGGVRVILEEKVELGAEFEVTLSTEEERATPVAGRVVWVQEEPDGVVAGIEFR